MRKEHNYSNGMITEKNGVFIPSKYKVETTVVMINGQLETKEIGKRLVPVSAKEFGTLTEAEKALKIK